jgi:hypothetical protein
MRTATTRIEASRRRAAVVLAACCWLALVLPPAGAQDSNQNSAPPPAAVEPPPPPPPPPRAGLFEAIGRWVDRGATNFSNHLRGAKRSMDDLGDKASANSKEMTNQAAKVGQGAADIGKDAVDATKNAVDAVAKLPAARMISGRERCATAPNGAPDCVTAAEALCRKKGFSTGKSMDFTSAEECPIKTIVGEASRDACTTVTFISRAMCQ